MINADVYVDVEPGTKMSYDVHVLDREVEFTIGRHIGSGSSLRLLLSDEHSFTELARMLTQARDEFLAEIKEHDCEQSERADTPEP